MLIPQRLTVCWGGGADLDVVDNAYVLSLFLIEVPERWKCGARSDYEIG
jgi:hypothetical protein